MTRALFCVALTGCALAHEVGPDANDDAWLDPPSLCVATGGHWRDGPCCPTRCGQECPERCVSSNCRCPDDAIWDDARGCLASDACTH